MNLLKIVSFAAAAMLLLPAMASAQTQLTCGTNAQGLTGAPGTVISAICPANCGTATIWGNGTYSDDSSVCAAAIHAGVLTQAGGPVSVTIAPGLSDYPSTTQNGVTSSHWGSWGRSFTLASPALACTTNARSITGGPGTVARLTCGPCSTATIWGTGTYSDDSSICTAAAHAGVINLATGGSFTVTIQPGLPDYPATTQNGISSSHWGSWGRSFIITP